MLEVGSVLSDLPAGLPKRFALAAAAYDQPLEARAQAILDDQVVDAAVQLASLTEEFASEIAEQLLASIDAVELLCTMLRMGTDDGRGAAATLLCEVASRNAAAKISFVEHSLLVPTWCRADPPFLRKALCHAVLRPVQRKLCSMDLLQQLPGHDGRLRAAELLCTLTESNTDAQV